MDRVRQPRRSQYREVEAPADAAALKQLHTAAHLADIGERGYPTREDGPVKVTIAAFGAMRQYLPDGGGRAQLEVPDGSSVSEVVDALGAPRRLVFAVLIDGLQSDIGHEVHEGAEVTLMPPFAGGR
jgi:molybdopterin converting factor small subunit